MDVGKVIEDRGKWYVITGYGPINLHDKKSAETYSRMYIQILKDRGLIK